MFNAGQEGIDRLKIGSGSANAVKIDLLPVEIGDRFVLYFGGFGALCMAENRDNTPFYLLAYGGRLESVASLPITLTFYWYFNPLLVSTLACEKV